jgi:osmotically-inducible protein OsmY
LRLEVLKQVRGAGLDLTWLNITVEHGIVHLWGAARSRMDQKAVRMAARGVDGVREVHDHSSVLPLKVAAALGTM